MDKRSLSGLPQGQGGAAFLASQELGRGVKHIFLCDGGHVDVYTMPSSGLSLTASVPKLLQTWPAHVGTARYTKVLLVLGQISSSAFRWHIGKSRSTKLP